MIVVSCNQKGGAGKTTVAVSLAVAWRQRGLRVLLVDADPQGSASTWAAVAAEHDLDAPDVITIVDGRTLARQLPRTARDYDHVVVDTPPRISSILRGALAVADVALVPAGAGGVEAWALHDTLEALADARVGNPDLAAAIVLTRHGRSRLAGAARAALADGSGLPVLRTELGLRVAFAEALTAGQGPTTYEPDGRAAAETWKLIDELEKLTDAKEEPPTDDRATQAA